MTTSVAIWTVSVTVMVLVTSVQESKADISCHYCGIKDLCPLPYEDKAHQSEESTKSIALIFQLKGLKL